MVQETGHAPAGSIQYVMIPPLQAQAPSHMKPQNMPGVSWPGSPVEKQGQMRPMMQTNLQLNPIQTRPPNQRLDHQFGVDNSRLGSENFSGQPPGQVHQSYEQATLPQSGVPMVQRASMGMRLHSRSPAVVASSNHYSVAPTIDVGLGAAGAIPRAELVGKRELPGTTVHSPNETNPFTETKGDTLFTAEDELSLSTTLFNMSLEHTGVGVFPAEIPVRSDDIRSGAEAVGTSIPRVAALQSRSGIPDVRSLTKTSLHGIPGVTSRGFYADNDRAGQSSLGNAGLALDQRRICEDIYRQPKLDLNTSVTDLLLSPAELEAGISLVRTRGARSSL